MALKSDTDRLKQIEIQCADMDENIRHFIHLCFNLIKKFHPLLGIQTQDILRLAEGTKDLGFYSDQDYKTLTTSAALINIGSISLSRNILSNYKENPDLLSQDDWSEIHKGPIYAHSLVSDFVGALKDLGQTLRAVRENWDGSGYPNGLARENIPLPARFLRIASHYVESHLPQEETVAFINDNSGSLFHPESVRLFNKITQSQSLPLKVKEILFSELSPGLKLAHPIHTPSGLLLCPEDTVINESSLAKISKFNHMDPITDRIIVYRDI